MRSFHVINYDFNGQEFEPYDVIPYLVRQYKELVERNKEGNSYYKIPKTKSEFWEFIKREAMSQWWGRTEYEIILVDWPCESHIEKWDVYKQLMMNIEIVAQILMEEVNDIA